MKKTLFCLIALFLSVNGFSHYDPETNMYRPSLKELADPEVITNIQNNYPDVIFLISGNDFVMPEIKFIPNMRTKKGKLYIHHHEQVIHYHSRLFLSRYPGLGVIKNLHIIDNLGGNMANFFLYNNLLEHCPCLETINFTDVGLLREKYRVR